MRIIIIGAGPTGLGAAYRLTELGHTDFAVYEKNSYVGGLAASWLDAKGFTWDFAVHVAHSHYRYFDKLMEAVLPDGFCTHVRKSWVYEYNTFVPYPFQYNFRHLPEGPRNECLSGLYERAKYRGMTPGNFEDWIKFNFGDGIAAHFMLPYNRKIWALSPDLMGAQWLGDRVPVVDVERVERNIAEGIDDVSWGPNATFDFPKKGGTGAIWESMARNVSTGHLHLNAEVCSIDPAHKTIQLADGSIDGYDILISTMPIPVLIEKAHLTKLKPNASRLKYTHTYVICVAVPYAIPELLADKTWIYCPEQSTVFYRVTPFSLFSPAHVPDIGQWCSFMCEIARSGQEPDAKANDFVDQTLKDLKASGLLPSIEDAHIYTLQAEYGYPVTSLDRDELLDHIEPELMANDIYSRGRFGGWKYEVGNMDHSVMQGVEAVNRILLGEDEVTLFRPNDVNS